MSEANWYVAHTYSGYENKVKANIEKTIENRHLQDQILEVLVPMEDVQEVKNGVTKQVQRKMFPGYVLVNMIMNDDTWYVVRNTRGVTGFVGMMTLINNNNWIQFTDNLYQSCFIRIFQQRTTILFKSHKW